MNKYKKTNLCITLTALIAFLLWTLAVTKFDLQAIGPQKSIVGFASLNGAFHDFTGVHMWLYEVTDWLGLVPAVFVLGFGLLGLAQLIKRRSLFKVDSDILILGVFYILVMAVYILFEVFVINYRPVLIAGRLEASYPSSTTLLVLCVMPTAIMQLRKRINKPVVKNVVTVIISLFIIFMVIGRLVSGVHWMTDIVGGVLLSTFLVMLYSYTENIEALKGRMEWTKKK
ncbi:phosphatase PAP2 family protein [Clostridium sp. AF19-22AC]|uniref:phosphatase PAP2 family protein n=1 Tax=Clostridia TaxID=186801 RepID=UPI000E4E0F49|nr:MULTISPECIES: phosphatase PAP2 family protein [Clostridia]RHR30760.1 phosphatase PAP2 family protein [Clostridium sp. AF19-22AC]